MAGPRILIVEDNHDLRQLFRTVLASAGFEVRDETNDVEVLRALDRERPDLVLLDLIPRTGYEGRAELAVQAHTRHIPVVIVTALNNVAFHRLNAACVLTKPVLPDRLVEAVRKCLMPQLGSTKSL